MELYRILEAADNERAVMGDEYVSTEHILLAMSRSTSKIGDMLRASDVSYEVILDALKEIRGSHRVTTDDPEATFNALEKFGRDLTQDARMGKLIQLLEEMTRLEE